MDIDPELERVARDDIPPQHARVIGVSVAPGGSYAVVMLVTSEVPAIEIDQTVAERVENHWQGDRKRHAVISHLRR